MFILIQLSYDKFSAAELVMCGGPVGHLEATFATEKEISEEWSELLNRLKKLSMINYDKFWSELLNRL